MGKENQDQTYPPGVIIYQDAFAIAESLLDYEQRGILITAIMHHFSGQDLPEEIDHDTETSFKYMILRSDSSAKNWNNKVNGAYGAIVKHCKQAAIPPPSRKEWSELGNPNFTEWRDMYEAKQKA